MKDIFNSYINIRYLLVNTYLTIGYLLDILEVD
jgi:hypothetical protein